MYSRKINNGCSQFSGIHNIEGLPYPDSTILSLYTFIKYKVQFLDPTVIVKEPFVEFVPELELETHKFSRNIHILKSNLSLKKLRYWSKLFLNSHFLNLNKIQRKHLLEVLNIRIYKLKTRSLLSCILTIGLSIVEKTRL